MTAREVEATALQAAGGAAAPTAAAAISPERRLREIVDRHYDFLWRTVRYLGVPDASAEDAAQQVLCVVARRLNDVVPGAELSFLYGTAVRVAKDLRRSAHRHPATPDPDLDAFEAAGPNPEDLLARRRAHEELHKILATLPEDQRMVFVLYEIEELTMAEIARMLAMAPGTVASRLRKARDTFARIVERRGAAARSELGARDE